MFGISVADQDQLTDWELEEFILIKNKKLQVEDRDKRTLANMLGPLSRPPSFGVVRRGR